MDIERLDEDNNKKKLIRGEKEWNFGTYMIKIRSHRTDLRRGMIWCLKDGEYHLTVLGVIARPDGTFLLAKRVMTKAWARAAGHPVEQHRQNGGTYEAVLGGSKRGNRPEMRGMKEVIFLPIRERTQVRGGR